MKEKGDEFAIWKDVDEVYVLISLLWNLGVLGTMLVFRLGACAFRISDLRMVTHFEMKEKSDECAIWKDVDEVSVLISLLLNLGVLGTMLVFRSKACALRFNELRMVTAFNMKAKSEIWKDVERCVY